MKKSQYFVQRFNMVIIMDSIPCGIKSFKDHCYGLDNLFPNLFIRYKIALEPIKNILET